MKVSVSLPDEDVDFVDTYATAHGYASRSAVVHAAIRMLRSAKLGDAYEMAWAEWFDDEDANHWDGTVGDGLAGG